LFSIFLFVLTTSTYAYEKGEVLLRTGMALMEPNASSEPLVVSSPSAGLAPLSLDSFLGTETGLGVQNSMAIAGSISYLLGSNWGIETLIGLPAGLKVTAKGLSALGVDEVGTVDVLPLTASVQYYPRYRSSAFQPYFGFGAYYAYFGEVRLDNELKAVFAFQDGAFDFESSIGYTMNGGIDWQLKGQWFASFSFYYIHLETNIQADMDPNFYLALASGSATPVAGELETKVEADTMIYFVTAGYRF
ncbi:MAG TPA: hypothetical protein DCZ03_06135, partial [Gammaproteobacteria bacterium]|nr:hypothetical protein [Gammaproteobacteria bacterium]